MNLLGLGLDEVVDLSGLLLDGLGGLLRSGPLLLGDGLLSTALVVVIISALGTLLRRTLLGRGSRLAAVASGTSRAIFALKFLKMLTAIEVSKNCSK